MKKTIEQIVEAKKGGFSLWILPLLFLFFLYMGCREIPGEEGFDNPLIKDMYTADAAALVYKNTIYLYTGHDMARLRSKDYYMEDWYAFSTRDFSNFENHGPALKLSDFRWANRNAWASQVVERKGKFYWYVSVEHRQTGGMAIGVAVSDNPEGPFKDAIGAPLITTDMTPYYREPLWTWDDIDPTVFIDDDGQAYMYFGNSHLKYVKLNPDMISVDTSKTESGKVADAIVEVDIPRVAGLSFTEAPWLHKRGETYYLSYAAGWPEQLVYCTSDSPTGPWRPGGLLMTEAENSNTSHQAIIEYKKNWYIFYHNGTLPDGGSWRRSVCVERLVYNDDGSIPLITPTVKGEE